MLLDELPTETVVHIFLSLPTITSALALSSTCHRFRHLLSSSKRLLVLSNAADREFGPIDDIIQVVTQNLSQSAHIKRFVPVSDALVHSVIRIGRIAAQWESMYPFKKWKTDYENRRSLTDQERKVFRRALYRLWLFTTAFHNREHPRITRANPAVMHERALLLHNYDRDELAEMLDVHNVLRDTVGNNVCPSNGTIRRKFLKRFPESNYQMLFNIHLNYPPPSSSFGPAAYYHSSANVESKFHNKFIPSRTHEPGAEGWGDDILHYYVVEDMLKLDPEQILYLKQNAPYKGQVEAYVRNLGEWFDNNGETFCQTLAFVLQQRGDDMEEFRADVDNGVLGVAVSSDAA